MGAEKNDKQMLIQSYLQGAHGLVVQIRHESYNYSNDKYHKDRYLVFGKKSMSYT